MKAFISKAETVPSAHNNVGKILIFQFFVVQILRLAKIRAVFRKLRFVFTCTRNSTGLKIPDLKGFLTKRLISDLDVLSWRFYRRGGNGLGHWY